MVTKQEIQEWIKNNPYATNSKLVKQFGISKQKASANLIAYRKKKGIKKSVGAFNNENGNGKQKARNIIIKHIYKSGLNSGKILSLPFSKCNIEKQILSEIGKKFSFIGYERDEKVYWKMFKTIQKHKLPIYPMLGDISYELETAHEEKYNHLILDYCCQLGTIAEDMKNMFQVNIVDVNGIIAITLSKRITKVSQSSKVYDEMNKLIKNENDIETIHAFKTFFSKVCGFNYSIEEIFEYHDTCSMALIIIKRLK